MLVIFDLDGTLLNTIADLAQATNYALEQTGFPPHATAAYPYFVGNGVRRLMERVLPEDMRSDENVDRLLEHFRSYYDTHLYTHTQPYPGIPELLRELRARGISVAVASNKYQGAVERLIAHFFPDIEWAAVRGQNEGIPVKPDPSIVFEILYKHPTPKHDVIYVGDSGVDIITARRAGVTAVGVTWGFRPESELRDNYADYIAATPEAVLGIVLSPDRM
ncbi:MAG: HAD family hydrolase [Paramuribaculum sp.]|nr:HAD family hydrolase [Paramuribaculum sp.]